MRRHTILTCAAAAGVLTIAGCSSGVSHPIVGISPVHILLPSPGGKASAMIVETSDTVLREHLLTLSDLPSGWKRDTGDAAAVIDANCEAASQPAYDQLPLHVEADFASSSGMPKLAETLAYGSTAQVDAAWSAYVHAMNACDHLAKIPFPRTADAVDARQAVTADGRGETTSFILVRKGNLLAAVTYSNRGAPNTSDVQQLVEEADAATAEIR